MLLFPAGATAAPVVVLGPGGHAVRRHDPFVTGPAVTPVPAAAPAATRMATRKKKKKQKVTVAGTLAGLFDRHQISAGTYHGDVAAYNHALSVEKRLHGTRRSELAAVTTTLHDIAAAHQLTASRLPALWATLAANVQWWSSGPLLAPDQRVEFAGSELVWQYYPGQGIQLQVLGTFGKADGLYAAGPSNYPALEQLLSEMIPLAARRGGGLTWEYYFPFDGGAPPWTSAMSQATGLEALSRAYQATGNGDYLTTAGEAMPVFTAPPPAGVGVRTARGVRFLQYTFTPRTKIINAFLQTLIGLDSYAQVSGDSTAARLFAAGDREARAEVPAFDTGAWSLYQPGVEDDLSYHQLVTGFLEQLCTTVGAPVYCTTAQHFQADLTTPPVLTQLTAQATTGKNLALRFRLSKISRVGVTITQGSHTLLATSAQFPHGVNRVSLAKVVKRPGTYGVVLAATDLAGNFTRVTGSLQVTRPKHRAK